MSMVKGQMSYERNFRGVIWTNHALDRMQKRGIKQGDAWATWRRPDQSREGSQKETWIYYKTFGGQTLEVVAKQNDKKEWIILSVWSRPVFEKRKRKKKSWGMLFLNRLLGRK